VILTFNLHSYFCLDKKSVYRRYIVVVVVAVVVVVVVVVVVTYNIEKIC